MATHGHRHERFDGLEQGRKQRARTAAKNPSPVASAVGEPVTDEEMERDRAWIEAQRSLDLLDLIGKGRANLLQ